MRFLAMALVMVALTACNSATATSDQASKVGKQIVDDTRNSWRDLFTYRRPPKPGDPQTRFCYQMQSDIVCYDTPQTHMTSRLVGYQDGDNISYIKEGGGALGVSTVQSQVFTQTSPYRTDDVIYGDVITTDEMLAPVPSVEEIRVDETNATTPIPNPTNCTPGMTPFECRESGYVPNADVGR